MVDIKGSQRAHHPSFFNGELLSQSPEPDLAMSSNEVKITYVGPYNKAQFF
jgi:hypothetical protein